MPTIQKLLSITVFSIVFTFGTFAQSGAGLSIDLVPASDGGTSSEDNITNTRNLSFTVSGVTPGAVVEIYRGSTLRYSMTSGGGNVAFSDFTIQEDGVYEYIVRERLNGTVSEPRSIFVTVDTVAPNVTINQAIAQPDPAANQPVRFCVESSEDIVGFEPGDVLLSGTADVSAAQVKIEGSGRQYGVLVSNILSDGAFTARVAESTVQDRAGNSAFGSTSTDNMIRIDTAAPTGSIVRAMQQAAVTKELPLKFAITFNESVIGLAASDISLAGSTADVSGAAVFVSGGGANYEAVVTGITSNLGNVKLSVAAGAVTDIAGNAGTLIAATDNGIAFDNVAPSVVVTHLATQTDPVLGSSVSYSVKFSEPVDAYQVHELSFVGSNIGTLANPRTINGSGGDYVITLSELKHAGTLKAQVFANAAFDSVGNPSTASNVVSIDIPGITAPTRTLEGRVVSPDGRGIRSAVVTVTDTSGRSVSTITSQLGFYRFDGLASGEEFTVRASSKRFRFGVRTVRTDANLTDIDLTGIE